MQLVICCHGNAVAMADGQRVVHCSNVPSSVLGCAAAELPGMQQQNQASDLKQVNVSSVLNSCLVVTGSHVACRRLHSCHTWPGGCR